MKKLVKYSPRPIGENLTQLLNTEFIIQDVRFEKRNFGDNEREIAVVIVDGKEYYTFSNVLIKQLYDVKKLIDEGNVVQVRLEKRKRYLTFV
jgi:hypothetical protein